jgi:2-polyprenyl-3-methyl-5-hydroxy-6-metoxy-1,4-benzoquinol methylase
MAYQELKDRQSVMWATAPYKRVTETIADIHELVVERLDPRPYRRWLDLACGTGAVAERAAARGAEVTGVDLASALVETARSGPPSSASRSTIGWVTVSASSCPTRASTRFPRPAG